MKSYLYEHATVKFEEVAVEQLPVGVIMRVRGGAHTSGIVTANATLYETDLYKVAVDKINPLIAENEVLMYPRHPKITKDDKGNISVESLSPQEATGLLRSLEVLPSGQVLLTADLADTTAGKNIAALVRMGAKVPISSRATASVKEVLLTDKHPAAKLNPNWVGKKIQIIQNDFRVKTYDFVSEEASRGNKTFQFREELGEREMDFDLKELTEDHWKAITESEKIKTILKEAVDLKAKELTETTVKSAKEQIAEFIKTPEFKAMFEEKKEPVKQVECKACKEMIDEGIKFCGHCGVKVEIEEEKKEPVTGDEQKSEAFDELSKKFDALLKKFEDVEKENKTLVDKDNQNEENAKVDAYVAEELSSKHVMISEAVKRDIGSRTLTVENMETELTESIKRAEAVVAALGIDPKSIPEGIGIVKPLDEENEDKKELTEDQKAQQGNLANI